MGAISEHLEAIAMEQIRNLVICVPPGCSKSLLVSTFYPAWRWTRNPSRRFIAATYGQALSEKNARLQRDLCLTPWYRARWPEAAINKDDVHKVGEFRNACKGWRFSTSVGGPATGYHADEHIGDDLVKAKDAEGRYTLDTAKLEEANDFWERTMPTRAANKAKLVRILIGQRLHENDAPGRAIASGEYEVLSIPMRYEADHARRATSIGWIDPRTIDGELMDPVRFPEDDVAKLETELTPRPAAAQLQQRPTPRGGDVFQRAWFQIVPKAPEHGKRILSVDCNFKDRADSDRVAIGSWLESGGRYYLCNVRRGPWSFTRTQTEIAAECDAFSPSAVYIEDKANGSAIFQTLRSAIPQCKEWTPTGSKEARAESVSPLYETGCVYLVQGPWNEEYIAELCAFPKGRFDDNVDQSSQALLILHKPGNRRYRDALEKARREMR